MAVEVEDIYKQKYALDSISFGTHAIQTLKTLKKIGMVLIKKFI